MNHATLSPSSAHRWLQCQASVHYDQNDGGNKYTAEGTVAHAVCEALMRGDALPEIGETIIEDGFDTVVDQAMHDHAQAYRDYIKLLSAEFELQDVEVALPLTPITGEDGAVGTADYIGIADGVLHVVDFKYGQGVRVEPENNKQLMLYGLAALFEYELAYAIDTVALSIVQPRVNHIARWDISAKALLTWSGTVRRTAARILKSLDGTLSEPLDYAPSADVCRWCTAKAKCPALQAVVTDAFDAFDGDTDGLGEKLDKAALAELWVSAVRAEAIACLERGETVAGYKLVEGRPGNRKWSSENALLETFDAMRIPKTKRFTQKLINPTQAEKQFKDQPRRWARLETLIERAPGKPTLAPESDKRPAIADTINDAFNTLDEKDI